MGLADRAVLFEHRDDVDGRHGDGVKRGRGDIWRRRLNAVRGGFNI